ncbi:3-dehydroquinate dehydratase [Candidatus Hepatincolaceae symbiont of Richtersius coronifer]
MKKILIINGPNLNLLGERQIGIYGIKSLEEINTMCINQASLYNIALACKQSNCEGKLIDYIQQAKVEEFTDIIINAAAYTHTSIGIMDALLAVNLNVYEVHLSNIYTREDFRKNSYISKIAKGVISGFKEQGYLMAIDYIALN